MAAVVGAWWKPILYLTAASAFMTGFLHPLMLGIVLGISHFHGTRKYQPSASNYGRIINLLTFNAGLHVEHHDIAAVPWHRLWKLRRMAAEFYDDSGSDPLLHHAGVEVRVLQPHDVQRRIR